METMRRHPTDMSAVEIDHSGDPGLVPSPWPDRFGRTGNMAIQPGYFEIDERARNIFPWRSNPRKIKTGRNDPDHKTAPLGYLLPYWMARDEGVLTAAD